MKIMVDISFRLSWIEWVLNIVVEFFNLVRILLCCFVVLSLSYELNCLEIKDM